MTSIQIQYLKVLIEKYKRYIDNLEWHVQTNMNGIASKEIQSQIHSYKDVIEDISKLLP